ncbi:unnamed protein product [Adineta steineri]|uniref:Ig-like domain-containing protein n=1 Tax=Adineta steineri TaxID=433720 RepID=A0A815P8N8_9BILA|nr:unnamed protein product [Adineta steineri]
MDWNNKAKFKNDTTTVEATIITAAESTVTTTVGTKAKATDATNTTTAGTKAKATNAPDTTETTGTTDTTETTGATDTTETTGTTDTTETTGATDTTETTGTTDTTMTSTRAVTAKGEKATTLPTARLKVDGQIRFHVVVKPTVLQVQRGQQVELTCIVYGGNLNTSIVWTQDKPKRRYALTDRASKNDKEITASQITLRSRITLDDPSKIGQYTCTALDDAGNAHSAVLTMQKSGSYVPRPKHLSGVLRKRITNHRNDICQPNEISCSNRIQGRKCVEKYWMCDGDRDCDDGSDEEQRYCDLLPQHRYYKTSEFQCVGANDTYGNPVCVRRSLQCDGYNDCSDHSDEVGCVKPTIISISHRQIRINTRDTLIIQCTARGTPTPYINWRLNWGHICGDGSDNGRCTMEQSIDTHDPSLVTGTLTVRSINANDDGTYSCEARNSQGFIFAIPDTLITVTESDNKPSSSTGCNCHGHSSYCTPDGRCQNCQHDTVGYYCEYCNTGYRGDARLGTPHDCQLLLAVSNQSLYSD